MFWLALITFSKILQDSCCRNLLKPVSVHALKVWQLPVIVWLSHRSKQRHPCLHSRYHPPMLAVAC